MLIDLCWLGYCQISLNAACIITENPKEAWMRYRSQTSHAVTLAVVMDAGSRIVNFIRDSTVFA